MRGKNMSCPHCNSTEDHEHTEEDNCSMQEDYDDDNGGMTSGTATNGNDDSNDEIERRGRDPYMKFLLACGSRFSRLNLSERQMQNVAAELWRTMSSEQRHGFIVQARRSRRTARRRRGRRVVKRKRSRRRSRHRRSRSRSSSRGRR